MHVFITGGAGLIGTFLTKHLTSQGHRVTIFDSFVNYMPPNKTRYEYIKKREEWIDDTAAEIIRGDTRNKSEVYRAINQSEPDSIVHLAALPIADLCNQHSEEAVGTILNGTINTLEAIRDVDSVNRFVYVSSSMVYGDFQYRPADENHPKEPHGVYGGTKYAGENLTRSYSNQYEIEHVVVRPSAVYGPTDYNQRVSQIFLERALKSETLELHNGGTQKLDFTYVEDTAQGLALTAVHEDAANETFNITRGQGRSLREFVEILSGYVDEVNTVTKQVETYRPERGALDITKAKELLGYEPQYSLEQGIEKYLNFVRDMNVLEDT